LKQRCEIILAGTGGQGLVVSGKLLGEAAIIEGKNVVQTQSYGIAQRGGLSTAELIIDNNEIIYQQVQCPDMVLALSESAIRKYTDKTLQIPVIYDNSVLKVAEDKHFYGFPFLEIALNMQNARASNLVALGAMIVLVEVVSFDSLSVVIRKTFSAKVAEANIQAVISGMEAARRHTKRE